jgi:dimethylaniline monooxygenase (N-oxide forming)
MREPASAQPGGRLQSRKIAVVGAGAAGLCAAKYLRQAGFSNITILEMGSNIGGMWCYQNDNGRSSAYKTLHINTAKNLTNFSDLPFDDTVQFFPSHWTCTAT